MAYSSLEGETGAYLDFVHEISDFPGFFPDMTRETAEDFLKDAPNNSCIIRPKLSNCCVISHKEKGRVKHVLLYKSGGRGGGFYLEKTTRMFASLQMMMKTYELNPLTQTMQSKGVGSRGNGYEVPSLFQEPHQKEPENPSSDEYSKTTEDALYTFLKTLDLEKYHPVLKKSRGYYACIKNIGG